MCLQLAPGEAGAQRKASWFFLGLQLWRVEGRRGPRRWARWQDHALVAMESWDLQTLSPVGALWTHLGCSVAGCQAPPG